MCRVFFGAISFLMGMFVVVPRTLSENAGLDATEVVAKLFAAHEKGEVAAGVDVDVRSFLLSFHSSLHSFLLCVAGRCIGCRQHAGACSV